MTLIQNERVYKMIQKHLDVRVNEKREFGEVFTPINIVLETLKLPKSCWTNPNLKWLDPACGIGNFPVAVYYKLMDGLKQKIKNKKARSKHIIENMLYMIEFNQTNVRKCRQIFKMISPDSKPNIKKCSYFVFKPEFEFDIIMGNPPWNQSRKEGEVGRNGVLWNKFILSAFKMLKPKGFLCFITPSGWRGPGRYSVLWDMMSSKQIKYIHIFTKTQAQEIFNISSRFDIFVIQNKPNTTKTEVIDEYGKRHRLNLKTWPFLPNSAYIEIKPILTTRDDGIRVIYDTYYHTQWKYTNHTKTAKFKYPIVHSIKKDGLRYIYSSKKKIHFGVPKVILSHNEHQYGFEEQNDYTGKYGMSEVSFGIPIKTKKEGDKILKAINSVKFKKIIAGSKWSVFQTPHHIFEYFKKDFYKHFN